MDVRAEIALEAGKSLVIDTAFGGQKSVNVGSQDVIQEVTWARETTIAPSQVGKGLARDGLRGADEGRQGDNSPMRSVHFGFTPKAPTLIVYWLGGKPIHCSGVRDTPLRIVH